MQIFIKTLTRTIVIDTRPTDSLHDVKQIICDKEGIPPEEQKLYHNAKQLTSENTVEMEETPTLALLCRTTTIGNTPINTTTASCGLKWTTLRDHNVMPEDTLHLALSVCGGAPKGRRGRRGRIAKRRHAHRRYFCTAKKTKHIKVKEPMATLKHYQLDEDGTLNRQRRVCPNIACEGSFLAKHHDRLHCGKCGMMFYLRPGTDHIY